MMQNTTVGIKHSKDESKGMIPHIGDNVTLCSGAAIIGGIEIHDRVTIGANSLVLQSIDEMGTYVGNPCKHLSKKSGGFYRNGIRRF